MRSVVDSTPLPVHARFVSDQSTAHRTVFPCWSCTAAPHHVRAGHTTRRTRHTPLCLMSDGGRHAPQEPPSHG